MNFLTSLCKILRFLIIYFKNLFMKFTAFILLLLTSIFLIACSANQANKKISNSELENLAKQYGGVYIFDEKFEKEIERQEQIRDSKRKEILERIKTIPNKNERNQKMREILRNDFLKEEPRIYPKYMYFDGKEMRIIKIYLSYTYIETKYGLFGDEGRGVSFTKESFGTKSGDNIFYLINNKFIKANKDK